MDFITGQNTYNFSWNFQKFQNMISGPLSNGLFSLRSWHGPLFRLVRLASFG